MSGLASDSSIRRQDVLDRVLGRHPPAFALLHRPETVGEGLLEVLVGEVSTPQTLAEIPVPTRPAGAEGRRHEVLTMIPFRQLGERGFDCADDGSPLIAMTVTDHATLPLLESLERIPAGSIELSGAHFDIDDSTYAGLVERIVADEIGQGEGSNFVIKRSFIADIIDYTPHRAMTFFRRLVEREAGAYWTFIVHTGSRTFVGASPERHVSLHDGTAVMNPISGTYRYPYTGPTLAGVMDFLADSKETGELFMTVDEELKMMARICTDGARVVGPYLKEMARLAHTEYFIEGRSNRDPREILRETMFAPTVTGSPVENACRVIRRYEPEGRGYYAGVVAVIGSDESGGVTMDSAILIRTAEVDRTGRLRIGVGATLVRDSDPMSEAAETRSKAAGLLAALDAGGPTRFGQHPSVHAALAVRNTNIAGFWLARNGERDRPDPVLAGRRVLIVDAEDTFTAMIGQQLRSIGLEVTVCRFDQPYTFDRYDLVIMGPGPGDPRDTGHPKIAHLRSAVRTLLNEQRPFLAVCLSHQVLCLELGFELVRRQVPNQGVQREIDLFGARERVGFYNTFAARCDEDKVECSGVGMVEVCRDVEAGEVHALRGPRFASMQFHAESVLTKDGVRVMSERIAELLRPLRIAQLAS
jgi:phenazine biosynthesis protein phzE